MSFKNKHDAGQYSKILTGQAILCQNVTQFSVPVPNVKLADLSPPCTAVIYSVWSSFPMPPILFHERH